jgi:hypothetical protein
VFYDTVFASLTRKLTGCANKEQTVLFDFPFSGDYREELHGYDGLKGIVAGEGSWLSIPSDYGRIWTVKTG